ncbi:MAG: carboxypeptidase regulatory-like domain-containing protein [Gemmatimonadetes bacterium]|nr:carboxypeptidase regulatory-like domain-containing protein [Gemmatimonadota bacterium]
MRKLVATLVLACAAAPASALQVDVGVRGGAKATTRSVDSRAQAMVWGQVRSEDSGLPLRFAVVEVVTQGFNNVAASTDSNGVYVLRNVPPGRRLLRVSHIDHAPNEIEILVVAQKQHNVDFDLEFRPVRLSAVMAEGARGLPSAIDTVSIQAPDLGAAAVRALEGGAGVAELAMQDAAREVPGREPVDPEDVLYVRGGAADLKLVLLNGAPVYAPFHIGGLINALDADVLRSANLYVGGAPARYDGGLSYVLDMETRSGRNVVPHAELGLDMLSGRALLEGPVGQDLSVLVSSRVVHGAGPKDLLGTDFPYGYGDALARADFALGSHHVLTLTGFWNHERVDLDSIGIRPQSASWGNHAGSLRYRGRLAGTEVLATGAVGHFRTLLPLGGIRPLMSEGTALRHRFGLDFERPFAGGRFFWGGSYEDIGFSYRAFEQGQSRHRPIVSSRASGNVGGMYGEAAYTVLPRLRVRGGLRADLFNGLSSVQLAPRFAATVLVTDQATLTLSGGQYRQYVRAPLTSSSIGVVPDSASTSQLTVAEASHVVLGLAQDLGEGIRLGLDGYFKEFRGLEANENTRTNSSGVDLWLRRNTGSLTGWLGYSLSWVWTVRDDDRDSNSFRGRHLVNAGASGPIVGRGLFDVRVSYGAGLPYTAIPEPEVAAPSFLTLGGEARPASNSFGGPDGGGASLPSEPNAPYMRVDAQVSRPFSGSVRSFDFQLVPYVRVINALNRRDAIFYHYSSDAGRAEPLADLPVLPVFGLEWKF